MKQTDYSIQELLSLQPYLQKLMYYGTSSLFCNREWFVNHVLGLRKNSPVALSELHLGVLNKNVVENL